MKGKIKIPKKDKYLFENYKDLFCDTIQEAINNDSVLDIVEHDIDSFLIEDLYTLPKSWVKIIKETKVEKLMSQIEALRDSIREIQDKCKHKETEKSIIHVDAHGYDRGYSIAYLKCKKCHKEWRSE